MGPEQLRLEGHQVPVAGREVDEALEVEVVLDPEGDRQAAHPDPGHRRVADVDQVDPGVAQEPGGVDRPVDPDRPRRVDLDRDDEPALGQGGRQAGRRRGLADRPVARRDDRSRCRSGLGRCGRGGRGRGPGPGAPRIAGGDRVERATHRGDVLGRRATAAADDHGSGTEHSRHDGREVVRPGGVHEATLDPLRETRVGHDRAGDRRVRASHPVERLEAAERTRAAVHPEGVDTGLGQGLGGGLGRRPVGRHELLAEGHLGNDRQVGRGPARLVDREAEVEQLRRGLDHEQVDAALEEAVDLLAEGRPDRRLVVTGQLAGRSAERTDRPGDQDVAAADVARLAGDLGAPPVEPGRLAGQPVTGEPEPVRPERGRLDQVGTGLDVLAVDGADEVGPARHELVETGALGDPP